VTRPATRMATVSRCHALSLSRSSRSIACREGRRSFGVLQRTVARGRNPLRQRGAKVVASHPRMGTMPQLLH
jgi:hypothetical protein